MKRKAHTAHAGRYKKSEKRTHASQTHTQTAQRAASVGHVATQQHRRGATLLRFGTEDTAMVGAGVSDSSRPEQQFWQIGDNVILELLCFCSG